jgi:hypothetical protein
MFSQGRTRDVIERGNPETPLGLYTDVDFDLLEVKSIWCKPWSQRLAEGKVSEEQLGDMVGRQLNVAKKISIALRAIGPARYTFDNGRGGFNDHLHRA